MASVTLPVKAGSLADLAVFGTVDRLALDLRRLVSIDLYFLYLVAKAITILLQKVAMSHWLRLRKALSKVLRTVGR